MTKTSKEYIAVIYKDDTSDYGVSFPDFPGCISAGNTLEEVKDMATEALQFHVDGILHDNQDMPKASKLDIIKSDHKNAEAFLIVSVKIPTKATRINVTVDEALLRKFDKYLKQHGETRSGFISNTIEKIVIRHA